MHLADNTSGRCGYSSRSRLRSYYKEPRSADSQCSGRMVMATCSP